MAPYKLKRSFDLIGSIVLLMLLWPLMLLTAIAVRWFSGSPVIHRRIVIGKGVKPYTMFKFRSMVVGAENWEKELYRQNSGKPIHDIRVTRIGKVLRRTSIDELPQLINVLNGTMSLIGPRPRAKWMMEELPASARQDLYTLLPGISGLVQIQDRYRRNPVLELEYCKQCSLGLDIKIFLQTIPAILSRKGAF